MKLNTSLPLPKVTLPVLPKVVVPAIVLVLPSRDTLKALAPALALTVMPVVTVTLSLKAMLAASAVSVKVTVVALTVLLNVVPPDCVTVNVPIWVPTTPLTVTRPVVLIVRFDEPLIGPVTDASVNAVEPPVPSVKVTVFARITASRLTAVLKVPPKAEVPPSVN